MLRVLCTCMRYDTQVAIILDIFNDVLVLSMTMTFHRWMTVQYSFMDHFFPDVRSCAPRGCRNALVGQFEKAIGGFDMHLCKIAYVLRLLDMAVSSCLGSDVCLNVSNLLHGK